MTDGRRRLAASLFTGAGIGDVGLRAAGMSYVVMAELDGARADVAASNFPEAKMVVGDVWESKDQISDLILAELASSDEELFLLSCTAPCQGMSKSGRGTLLNNARQGKRPHLDPRNRLILPALDVIRRVRPRWVVFENVSEMAGTLIEDNGGQLRLILDIITEALQPEYVGRAYDLEFADYGIPQRRRRLITVFTRDELGKKFLNSGGEFVPDKTHAAKPHGDLATWVPVRDVLETFPPLDARSRETASHAAIPFHRVPLLDAKKYEWVSASAPGASAFDNQCNACGFDQNPTHGNRRDNSGINRSIKDTPIRCLRCDEVLPRPHVIGDDGQPRIMSGFTSAYKRMSGDLPAPALTRNLSYACSDQKVHPTQNRVLSLAEAFAVHTLSDYPFTWQTSRGTTAKDALVRLVLGESIPPRLMEAVGTHIIDISKDRAVTPHHDAEPDRVEPSESTAHRA